jgi:uncharacterized PurR-regulated membrane protein YhhQ (DUF165 family)
MTPAHRRALETALVASAYIGTVIIANHASAHWSALHAGPLLVPAGTLFAGTTFTLRDFLHDALHTRGVTAAIAIGAAVSWLLASPRIAVASVLAFTASELLDAIVYARLHAGSWLRAVVGSNIAGLVMDSVLFVPLAFGSFAAMPGQILGKSIATTITVVPLVALRARWRVVWR